MIKKTIFIVSSIILVILGCFLYQSNKKTPEQIVELVLNSIASDTAEIEISNFEEHFRERYQEYFTEEALKRALETRTLRAFQKAYIGFEGPTQISSLELEHMKSSTDNVELYGTVITDWAAEDGVPFTQTWYIKSSLSKESGTWKICYFTIDMGK